MSTPLYRLGTGAYHLAIRLAARVGVGRAQRWVAGRRVASSTSLLHLRARPEDQVVWMHCASLGEFEQGRPVLESLREARPEWRVLLTFFSPSGYERCHADPLADHVAYLPADSPENAAGWVAAVRPAAAIFVKYEFWFYHLRALDRAGVPTFLIAASFRPNQWFFQRRGGWWRRMLRFFSAIIVQTEQDRTLLTGPGTYPAERAIVAGDPRMDRTLALAKQPFSDPILAAFADHELPVVVAGSVWPEDVARWRAAWPELSGRCRLVLAPHQLNEAQLTSWREAFGAVRYTQTTPTAARQASVLLLDTIGLLSRAYRYGRVAYVGGAFRTGLHNTLEPLAYGLPVVFGPNHHKFPEAAAALRAGGAASIRNGSELADALRRFLSPRDWRAGHHAQQRLARENSGAGRRTAQLILNRLPPPQSLP